MTEICSICEIELTPENRIEHHINYNPEIKVLLCRKCHGKEHKELFSKALKRINQLKKEGLRNRLRAILEHI